MNNYSVGNLVKIKGTLKLDTYTNSIGKMYADLLMEPLSIEKLKDTNIQQCDIQLKY